MTPKSRNEPRVSMMMKQIWSPESDRRYAMPRWDFFWVDCKEFSKLYFL